MFTLPANPRIASAHVVFNGNHGEVSQHARTRGISRPALYRQAYSVERDLDPQPMLQHIERLKQQYQQARQQIQQLQKQQQKLVLLDNDRLAQFACTAVAEGVSLPTSRRLLEVFLGAKAPSVSKLGRFSKEAGEKAAALLQVLDQQSALLLRQGCADEIFVGTKPILMVVEPQSLCWQSGKLVEHRDGPTWAKELESLSALEQLTRDGGSGMAKAVEQVNVQRTAQGKAPIAEQLDHFHLLRDAKKALRTFQARATRALEVAELADKAVARRHRTGKSKAGVGSVASRSWRQAEEAMQLWDEQERLWGEIEEALPLFDSQGELNSRARAESTVAEVLPKLVGSAWDKVRRQLQQKQLWTYLDQVERGVSQIEGDPSAKRLLLRGEGLRRRPEALRKEGSEGGWLRGVVVLVSLLMSKLGSTGLAMMEGLRGVVSGTVRASSVVEGLNSVVRMHQSRHRRVSQGMLDLKRLNWNLRRFRTGKRKKKSPYELLGIRLPCENWWNLLKLTPEQLRSELSALNPTN